MILVCFDAAFVGLGKWFVVRLACFVLICFGCLFVMLVCYSGFLGVLVFWRNFCLRRFFVFC